VEVLPANQLEVPALAELFNACYAGYLVDLNLDEAAFRQHLDSNDIDLGCSRIAVDTSPVAVALIARRDAAGWVGGMGTIQSHRRRGIGERVLIAALEEARERGCEAVWLEVIDRNEPAIELYFKLGFERVRDLIVWSMPAPGGGVPPHRAITPDEAHAWIVHHRDSREPWQRADESLTTMMARRSTLRGLVVDDGDEVTAAVLFDDLPGLVTVMQVAAVDERASAQALVAAAGGDRPLRLSNAPADSTASRALESLGAAAVVRQHEMVTRPR
jgi:ribosomal protein S18 acetylase RimI-like enzyme